jgi:hypothetical protein
MNARPHPDPLPQEREKRSPLLGVVKASDDLSVICFDEPSRSARPFDSRKYCGGQWLFPLLGGEGQGEGEREYKLLLCLP